MKCYIVMYDLRKQRNYEPLWNALKSFSFWGRITESTWAVVSHQSSSEIRDHLLNFIDSDDRICVIKSGGEAAWQNSIANNQWLKDNLVKI